MPKPIQFMEERGSSWFVRLLAPLTLLEWGAILTYFYCSHRLTAFLHPYFHEIVLLTGLLLLASAACVFWCDAETKPISIYECGETHCSHSHFGMSAGRLFFFLILSVPVALAAIISPDVYGLAMIRNRGIMPIVERAASVAPSTSKCDAALSTASQNDGLAAVEVGDLLIAGQTESGMAQYDGKRVELTGQVFPLGQRKFEIVRMLMLCCAADVQMLAVRVVSDHDLELPALKWTKVIGRVGFIKKGDHDIPVVTAEKVLSVQRPADPYVYRGGTLPSASQSNFKLQIPPR